MRLNLGCGREIREGYINADLHGLPGVDVVFDMDVLPWPWDDDTFDEVIARSIIEHSRDKMIVIEELWRVAKHGCDILVTSCPVTALDAWADPTHRSPMHWQMFNFFVPGHPFSYYSQARFITYDMVANELYLEWHLLAYKRPDQAMLARQIDNSRWCDKWEGRMGSWPQLTSLRPDAVFDVGGKA